MQRPGVSWGGRGPAVRATLSALRKPCDERHSTRLSVEPESRGTRRQDARSDGSAGRWGLSGLQRSGVKGEGRDTERERERALRFPVARPWGSGE